MLWRTHFAGGMLAGTGAGLLFQSDPLLFASVAGFASLLPDLDSPKSKLGRKTAPASALINAVVGHRGAMHSLLAAGLISAASLFALRPLQLNPLLSLAVTAGYVSHLLLDALNPQGVPLLWPWEKRFHASLCQTGGWLDRVAFYPLAAAVVWVFFTTLAA